MLTAVNSDSDTLKSSSLSTEKLLNLKTVWSESSNAASLTFFDFDGHFGSVYFGFNNAQGDYRLFQAPDQSSQYGFYSNGYVKEGKWKFYGNFNYYNAQEKNIKWTGVIEPYNENPYTVGDSIGGNYWKEYFKMQGKGAFELNRLVSLGFDIRYDAGVGTKRKDPRPTNIITSFDVRPGVVFNLDKIKIGTNFRYQGGKEDINFEKVTDNKFDIFYFKGLGTFSSETSTASGFNDSYTISNLYGGSLQFTFDTEFIRNYTSANFDKKVTDIKRGASDPLQIALVDNYITDINSVFLFGSNDKKINRLGLNYVRQKIYGQEPVVEPKLLQVTYQWSTVAKYTLYWNEASNYNVNYSYYDFTDTDHINWGAKINCTVSSDKTTYYFVPEYNKLSYNQFVVDGLLEKGFVWNKWESLFSANGGYRMSFDNSLEIVTDEKLLENVRTDFINQDFNYYTSGLWQIGASVKIGRQISINHSPVQFFLDAGYKLMVSDLPGDLNWEILELKLGMNF
ncbi:MAG: hypothetical protein A2W90_00955 [Bacteroidetes bacterium GWF2_42_66]|nr:MAG: hypothetical protein A2W92_24345 [Bacteroidetes bacterium GWA2_42_15]OFX99424.1 MAG: hypothetical protein A2W89_12360 [Bacteroidetes bacterium GWE2_42_39]OFY40475.1 MAG: hypothetical protein A2W90_00955 [Bacteroidetes bacterium GWF2_42_66]HBL76901.1 hypothetical protein [Prolixibacteraceae bacterium]HCR92310.1 hypothetical protein [Prolixibacteraceae bacterium]